MSLYNEILAGRFNRLLGKMMSVKGNAPSPQLSGDITPIMGLEIDRPEWGYLNDERRYIVQMQVAGAATFNTRLRLRLRNPNMIVTIEGMMVSTPSAQVIELYTGGSSYGADLAGGGAGAVKCRDARLAESAAGTQVGNGSLTGSYTNADTATSGTAIWTVDSLGNTPILLPFPLILGSSNLTRIPQGFEFRALTVNTTLRACVWWRERQAEEGELPVPGSAT